MIAVRRRAHKGMADRTNKKRSRSRSPRVVRVNIEDMIFVDRHGRFLFRGGKTDTPGLLIQATILNLGDATKEGQLVEGVAIPWFTLLRELDRNPQFLFQIPWWKLEELIAGAYKREGWRDVVLTPRTGDKGRDVIASKPGIGAIRIVDQVKAYKPGHKVRADDVRALLGVLLRDRNVSKAVVTTTATFAPGVKAELASFIPYRLELKDGALLKTWLKGLMRSEWRPLELREWCASS
jgi:restriction system protein